MWIKSVQPLVDTIASAVTVVALIVGAVWSRRTIFKKREEAAKIRLSHNIFSIPINEDKRLVRIKLTIENQGSVLVCLDELDTWMYQVKPLPSEILDEKKMLDHNLGCYKWPGVLGASSRTVKPQNVQIEPNESQDFHFDFVIENEIEVVIVYSYVNNPTKKIGIGWNLQTIHEFIKENKEHGSKGKQPNNRRSRTARGTSSKAIGTKAHHRR